MTEHHDNRLHRSWLRDQRVSKQTGVAQFLLADCQHRRLSERHSCAKKAGDVLTRRRRPSLLRHVRIIGSLSLSRATFSAAVTSHFDHVTLSGCSSRSHFRRTLTLSLNAIHVGAIVDGATTPKIWVWATIFNFRQLVDTARVLVPSTRRYTLGDRAFPVARGNYGIKYLKKIFKARGVMWIRLHFTGP